MTNPENLLKIFTVSLVGTQRAKCYAVWNGEQLVITAVAAIGSGLFRDWRDKLLEEIEEKKAAGFAVLVEEMGTYFDGIAPIHRLEEPNDEGRSNFFEALDWYFQLSDLGCLILHKDCQQHALRAGGDGSRLEKKQDDKGRTFWNVDWKWLNGSHRAQLLAVVAVMAEPLSDRYLEAMFGPQPTAGDERIDLRWRRVLQERDIERGKQTREAREGRQ